MIVLDLSILNQKGTPMFNSDTFANRPAFGIVGRIFISTDTKEFYRDTGTSWELIGGPGSGTITGSGAATQVAFWNSASTITGSNNLFWDSTNNYLGISTNTPTTALDVHHSSNSGAIFNQTTGTNNNTINFQTSGSGRWRIGNFYTAGADDFGIFDVVGSLQQLTILKTTGQTFIGAKTTASGRLVVNSATADAHLQVVGANSPSIRIDNAGSGGTQRFVFGLATATNNFIQGATAGEFCISTQSAGNMLFGMWQTINASEVMRITTSNNLLVGLSVDGGQRLQVGGNALISSSDASGTFFEVKRTSTTDRYFRVLATGNIEASSVSTADPNYQFITGANNTSTSSDRRFFWLQNNFSPTSGTATYRSLEITTTINQTGGANGITRGLYVAPSLTSAADWRSIEWSNNTGFGLYGAGTANNYLAGSLGIGTTSLTGVNLYVVKAISGSTISTGIFQQGVVQSGVTIFAFGFNNTANLAASTTLSNYYHYSTDQSSFGAGATLGNQVGFFASGAMTSATNNYGFRGALTNATGRWNLYMDGTADNYLEGKLIIGTTVVGGSKLRIVGLPTSAVGLSSGDIYSNAGILTIVP
jgi:hypothetical protein